MVVQPHLLSLSAYIDQNLEKDLPLSSLARRVGLSPFHFHRKFGAYFGESLHQHIKRLRLERSAFELTYGPKSVHDVALTSGYKTVSAFSHAFSGFHGESPTRYRRRSQDRGRVNGSAAAGAPAGDAQRPAIRPAWIGDLDQRRFAFVRAAGHGRGPQPSVREALDTITGLIELPREIACVAANDEREGRRSAFGADPQSSRQPVQSIGHSTARPIARPIEFIAATTDFFGIFNGGAFRIDVGLDADRMPHDREDALGMQVLPGGRYARFDFLCRPGELIDRCYRAAMHGLRGTSESSRTSSHFVRFTLSGERDEHDARNYRFFMPLVS